MKSSYRTRALKAEVFSAIVLALAALRAPEALAQVSRAAVPLESAVAQAGREYYLRYCAACHGFDAKGDGPVAPALAAKPSDLTTITQRRNGEFPMDELSEVIDGRKAVTAHGSREMPVWGERFGRDVQGSPTHDQAIRGQILMLLVYLQSIQR